MKRDISETLDSCINEIIMNGKTIEDCLDLNSDVRSELEPLLVAAMRVSEHGDIRPSDAGSKQGRESLLAAVERRRWETGIDRVPDAKVRAEIERDIDASRRRFAIRFGVLTLLFALMSGATMANASQSSIPGSSLYPIKRTLENARMIFAKNDTAKQQLYMKAAENRLQELEQLPKASPHYAELATEVEDSLEKAEDIDTENTSGETENQLQQLNHENQNVLKRVFHKAPESERDSLEKAIKRAESRNRNATRTLRKTTGTVKQESNDTDDTGVSAREESKKNEALIKREESEKAKKEKLKEKSKNRSRNINLGKDESTEHTSSTTQTSDISNDGLKRYKNRTQSTEEKKARQEELSERAKKKLEQSNTNTSEDPKVDNSIPTDSNK